MTFEVARLLQKGHVRSAIVAFLACVVVEAAFLLASERFLHWFMLPVLACGVLVGIEAIDWIRGRLDLFDPLGILSTFGLYFFFIDPLLHVYWDNWMPDGGILAPPEWRDWVGAMAVLNALGLLLYRWVLDRVLGRDVEEGRRVRWTLDRRRFYIAVAFALAVAAAVQVWVYASQGGIAGYIATFVTERSQAFGGMGLLFVVSDSFPVLAILAYSVFARDKRPFMNYLPMLAALLLFFILKLLFGGLRGSRSNTIFALFWAVGMIHCWVRPIPRQLIPIGLAFMFFFMYTYGFYKSAGIEGLRGFVDPQVHTQISSQFGRGLEDTLLGNFGRSDVQAYLLYKTTKEDSDYVYAMGRTYLGTAALLVPRSVWPERPPTKVKEGTEALYGTDAYGPGKFTSSRLYGVTGEAMLNFGPAAAPIALMLFGLLIGRLTRFTRTLAPGDIRLIVVPFLTNLAVVMLTSDSDNVAWFLTKGILPVAVLLAGLRIERQLRPRESTTVATVPVSSIAREAG